MHILQPSINEQTVYYHCFSENVHHYGDSFFKTACTVVERANYPNFGPPWMLHDYNYVLTTVFNTVSSTVNHT